MTPSTMSITEEFVMWDCVATVQNAYPVGMSQ